MPIDHSNIDSPLLGHPSQVILDCVKLTKHTDGYRLPEALRRHALPAASTEVSAAEVSRHLLQGSLHQTSHENHSTISMFTHI